MEQSEVIKRLRRFLLGVVAFIFGITVVELILLDHTEQALQWIPFVVSGAGVIAVAGAFISPGRTTMRILRWVMAAVALSSFVGVYYHFSGNLAFTMEINPSFSVADAIWPAMKGSYPLLAPGILFLAGILGLAVTYQHPLLTNKQE
jgi:hypothetical protein